MDEFEHLDQLESDLIDILDVETLVIFDHFPEAVVGTVLKDYILLIILVNDLLAFDYVLPSSEILLLHQGIHVSEHLMLPLLAD